MNKATSDVFWYELTEMQRRARTSMILQSMKQHSTRLVSVVLIIYRFKRRNLPIFQAYLQKANKLAKNAYELFKLALNLNQIYYWNYQNHIMG